LTSRERLFSVVSSKPADRRPKISWPKPDPLADAQIVTPRHIGSSQNDEKVVLVEVTNPFQQGLYQIFQTSQERGAQMLDAIVENTRQTIAWAISEGADGIFYRLHGATAAESTPMQYGGNFLERDRELLDEVKGARMNVLYVVGGEGLYLDFVSDLPAHVFAWDSAGSGFDSKYVRSIREGAQASSDLDSEIEFCLAT